MNKERVERANLRRKAMLEADVSTYETLGQESPAIVCLCCGFTSSNPNDIAQRYCSFCKVWHRGVKGPDAFHEFSDQWIEEVAWGSGYMKAGYMKTSERIHHMRDTLLGQITELEKERNELLREIDSMKRG